MNQAPGKTGTDSTGKNASEKTEGRENVKPEIPMDEEPPNANDKPAKHGITFELVQAFLRRFLPEDSRFVVKHYRYRPVANLGQGYTTVRKVLEVEYQDEGSRAEQMAAFVVKVPGGHFTTLMREMGGYEREVVMYSQVAEHFRHILTEQGREVLLPFPRFVYGTMVLDGEVRDDRGQLTTDQTPREKLVIEMLDGYEVIDKKTGLDLEHVKLVMSAIARVHAIGLVLRERHLEKADRVRQVRSKVPDGLNLMSVMLSPCLAALESAGLTLEAAIISDLIKKGHLLTGYNSSFTEDRAVVTLVHGDLWYSNMMFKYRTEADGAKHPEEVRFVDLQLCQFGDLAYDLVYCLMTSTRRETRRGHLRQLLTWYEAALRLQLEELGEDADQLAPWLNQENLHSIYGSALYTYFCSAMLVVQITLSTDEDNAEMKAPDSGDQLAGYLRVADRWREGHCNPELTQRLTDIVEDLKEFGHL